ncbi:hypothetical protein Pelo_6678 [Pelomyxa schiedti]|nr:hypothetical protein Pelo_6678 [Pelomyxa schiedti]
MTLNQDIVLCRNSPKWDTLSTTPQVNSAHPENRVFGQELGEKPMVISTPGLISTPSCVLYKPSPPPTQQLTPKLHESPFPETPHQSPPSHLPPPDFAPPIPPVSTSIPPTLSPPPPPPPPLPPKRSEAHSIRSVSRTQLLKEIERGTTLKKIRTAPSIPSVMGPSLAQSLSFALATRRTGMGLDDSDSDELWLD